MRIKRTFEKLQAEALKFNTKREFKSGNYNAYSAATKKGILNIICAHMPQVSNFPWSDEDIRNYHQLKDDWFASKGIEILHIKEEDWNLNKESCIKTFIEFISESNKQIAMV